jgi:hypothetical protein
MIDRGFVTRGVVSLRRKVEKLDAEISLPAGITGEFIWRGTSRLLNEGQNNFSLP